MRVLNIPFQTAGDENPKFAPSVGKIYKVVGVFIYYTASADVATRVIYIRWRPDSIPPDSFPFGIYAASLTAGQSGWRCFFPAAGSHNTNNVFMPELYIHTKDEFQIDVASGHANDVMWGIVQVEEYNEEN